MAEFIQALNGLTLPGVLGLGIIVGGVCFYFYMIFRND